MRLTVRIKLLAIIGASALGFGVLMLISTMLSTRVERELSSVQQRYLPKVEWGPRLDAQLLRMGRAFQDAVAARDSEALARTQGLKDSFLEQLSAAGNSVEEAEAGALRKAVEDYYAAAFDVCRRLIAGETGEPLVEAMAAMQARQASAAALLKKATTLNRDQLSEAFSAANQALKWSAQARLGISVACLAAVIALSLWLARNIFHSLTGLSAGIKRFGKGDFGQPIAVIAPDELGELAEQANQMADNLTRLMAERDRTSWLKGALAGLAQEIRGELEPQEVASRSLRFLARYLEAPVAALYYFDQEHVLRLFGQYAHSDPKPRTEAVPNFRAGEGLVGQAALQDELMVVADPPPEYLRVRSGLGEGTPRALVFLPLIHAGKTAGVLELASFKPWSELATELLLLVRDTVTIAIEVALARTAARELLAETQRQAQRLTAQEEELRSSNEELQAQQEELHQTNEELRQQTEQLEAQRRVLEEKNVELDQARRQLEQKAAELTTVSTYKSQFLTNMSHELRTPLNSMLLLSSLLSENQNGNLDDKQVEFAKTIHGAGKDLLGLINQVLDLAKIEAGKQEIRVDAMLFRNLADHVRRVFEPLAHEKGLAFVVDLGSGIPEGISTDPKRVEQIINNLLGNAIKFTERGEVAFRILKSAPEAHFRRDGLNAGNTVALIVSDTGVGISPENQERIFKPFEQVEATSDRRYGGTGLGLTIARELAFLLGGEVQLQSAPGKGSLFTCYLPLAPMKIPERSISTVSASRLVPSTSEGNGRNGSEGGRAALGTSEEHFLIIEDDPIFANAFGELISAQGLKFAIAADGHTGLRLAKERKPRGIILDVNLPDIDGWQVIKELRRSPETAAIPVHFVSAVEGEERGRALGAVGYLNKPATKRDLIQVIGSLAPQWAARASRVLIVEDQDLGEESLLKRLAGENLELHRVNSAQEALEAITNKRFGCVVLDISLPQTDGLELLKSVQEQCGASMPSVVVYTARPLSKDEAKRLEAYTEAIVVKEGPSADRLVNEIRLFVRRLKEGLGPRNRPVLRLYPEDVRLRGRRVLLVDDDMRTLYALSATLRAKGVEVHVADTGREALKVLAQHSEIEAVLMDIMMPEMDGYEAMRRIRQDERFRNLPIIALTAKAMIGDREKCLEAGATNYLPKPLDPERLIAMLHSYLSPQVADGPRK